MIGVFMLFKAKQSQIRQDVKMQIKAGVPESELTVFTFDSEKIASLRWVDDHEFVYRGQMYDVVKKAKSGDKTTYFCLADHEETKLFTNLNKLVGNELAKDKTNSGNKTSVFVNWFFTDRLQSEVCINNFYKNIPLPYTFFIENRDDIPEIPPPRYIVSNIQITF